MFIFGKKCQVYLFLYFHYYNIHLEPTLLFTCVYLLRYTLFKWFKLHRCSAAFLIINWKKTHKHIKKGIDTALKLRDHNLNVNISNFNVDFYYEILRYNKRATTAVNSFFGSFMTSKLQHELHEMLPFFLNANKHVSDFLYRLYFM